MQNTTTQACDRLRSIIRVDGCQGTRVSGIQSLEQIKRLGPANLTKQDSVGSVAKRGFEQLANRDSRQRRLLSPCLEQIEKA